MQLKVTKTVPPAQGKSSYRITASDGETYFWPTKKGGGGILENMVIEAQVSKKEYNNKIYNWIDSYEPIKDINADLAKIKAALPGSKIVSENGYSQIQTPVKSNFIGDKDFLIVLQSASNRQANWTPDQKLKWVLENYKAGPDAVLKRLHYKNINNGDQEIY